MNRWRHIVSGICAAVLSVGAAGAAELDKLTGVRLVDNPANDGDSFIVRAGDRELHLRLYYVDCPETVVSNDVDAKRVREQAGYFGLTNVAHVVALGQQAKAFVEKQLAQPFTVYTAYADAMGRSPTKRVYAFVVTAAGHDLACELVENGLARVFGTRRAGPNGVSSREMGQRLRDLEARAILKRAGAWLEADPDELVRLRAVQREEEQGLEDVRREVAKAQEWTGPVDLNKASSRQLQSLPGIGPVVAANIIAGRPYHSVEDLLRVNGVGSNVFEKIRPRLMVNSAPPQPGKN